MPSYMEHKGEAYEVTQLAPMKWKWIVHFKDGRQRWGEETSKGKALFKAVRTIDEAECPSI